MFVCLPLAFGILVHTTGPQLRQDSEGYGFLGDRQGPAAHRQGFRSEEPPGDVVQGEFLFPPRKNTAVLTCVGDKYLSVPSCNEDRVCRTLLRMFGGVRWVNIFRSVRLGCLLSGPRAPGLGTWEDMYSCLFDVPVVA